MSKPEFFITDVFTDRRYGGNPLATFIDCESLSDAEMQQIAREINFSETTFITSLEPRNGGYDVRIFTPRAEVDFAGHPALGTAHVIRNKLLAVRPELVEGLDGFSSSSVHGSTSSPRADEGRLPDEIMLNLRIGPIPVTFTATPAGEPVLWMKQMSPQFGKQLDAATLADVLNLTMPDIEQGLPIEEVSTGFPTLIVPLKNLDALKRVKIDKEKYFALVSDAWARIILVFSREAYEAGQALSVRMFADYYGVPEDPATGSSNGCLAAYLAQHRVFGSTEFDLLAGQGYEIGRPSTLALRTRQAAESIEVFIGGGVVDVARGIWG
ncbi:MAG TPA: PhzF family phenazine biosynthesis protein [Gallionella sp.]|nr:PhzF family phenazine biosynthesis protein [Gallionella sp.]